MKKMLSIFCAAAAALLLAAESPEGYVSKSGSGTTAVHVLFAANPSRSPRLLHYDVTSDLSTSVLTIRAGTTTFNLATAATNATNFVLSATSGLASNDIVVLQRVSDTAVFRGVVYSVPDSTNLNLTAEITGTFVPGDTFHLLGTAWTSTIGAATARISAEAIANAPRGRPLSVSIDGTSACSVNAAAVKYD